jgi:hypothetical protein
MPPPAAGCLPLWVNHAAPFRRGFPPPLTGLLRQFGPQLRRPHCDTLNGSKHANMKELRFTLPDGEWRIAFAFDPRRQAILLVGGSKSGTNERRFYRDLIRVADERFNAHLKKSPKRIKYRRHRIKRVQHDA